MHAVIFSGGSTKISPLIKEVIKSADFFIAADSGAQIALQVKVALDVVVGDFDSIDASIVEKLKAKHVKLMRFPEEKNETDTELALDRAIKQGATEITIIGGNDGDRFDHVIANLFLAVSSSVPVRFVNGNQVSWIMKGPAERTILGEKDELVSLIPLKGDVEGITLEGLKYGLTNETLLFGKPRGISNVFVGEKAKITFKKGVLLCIHTCGS